MARELNEQDFEIIIKEYTKLTPEFIRRLEAALSEPLSEKQKAVLIAFETRQIEQQEETILGVCSRRMDSLIKTCPSSAREYQIIKQLFRCMLEITPFELLNQPRSTFVSGLFGSKNAFTLALDHMISLYHSAYNDQLFAAHDLAKSCYEDIFVPMLNRQPIFNVDVGHQIEGTTNLMRAWKFNIPREGALDPLSHIANFILVHTQQITTTNTSGQNVLYACIARRMPARFIEPLIRAGADVHAKCLPGGFLNGGGGVKIPLLSHCVKNKQYETLRLLLAYGADPNSSTERWKMFSSNDGDNETEITPYQLAVALEDEVAVSIFIEHSEAKGIPLLTEIDEDATHWTHNMGNFNLKVYGTGLVLNCKHRLFKAANNLLTDIDGEFGIRCYVKNPQDRDNVAAALRWLATEALVSPIGKIWRPIFECLKEHMQNKPNFALYVSSIPRDVSKSQSCRGLTHDNIYAESGLSVAEYKSVFAHEAAHMYDKIKIGLNMGRFQWQEQPEQLAAALEQDINCAERFSTIGFTANAIKKTYKENHDQEPFKEFFAYLLVSDVITRYLNNTDVYHSETAIFEMMSLELPRTFTWYRTHVMEEVLELDTQSDPGPK